MSDALIVLASVAAGAFITGWVSFMLERYRHQDRVFLAKRLVGVEIRSGIARRG